MSEEFYRLRPGSLSAISVDAMDIAGASIRRLLRLTLSGRFLLCRIAHWAIASFVPPPRALLGRDDIRGMSVKSEE